jgi:YidC/Oxa1 family membrane protein insertase
MLAMQRLQPEMKKLQAKYKGAENREQLNQEMMRLYKENGTSPFGACLPSLLQMPFLIVLYTLIRGLSTTVSHGQKYINQFGQYVTCQTTCGAPRYIPTNSQMHNDLVVSKGQMHWWFGMDLSSYPFSHHTSPGSASQAVLVLPYLVLIAAAMFLQYYQMKQMNNRNPQAAAANPQMQTMQKFFPIIFGVIYLKVPAGATIYMVVSSAMRIGTQEVMFKTGMVEPVAVEREIGSSKEEKEKQKPKPPPPPPKRTSAATDGTSLAKGTVPPKPSAGGNGRGTTNGRKSPNGRAGRGAAQPANPAPKAQNRSRSKRSRKAR